jgi:hypothetical protein
MALLDILLTGAFLGSTLFTIFLLLLPSRYQTDPPAEVTDSGNDKRTERKVVTSVQIIVLGDIGRSPRMQYHAISIAKNGGLVDLIGYQGQQLFLYVLYLVHLQCVEILTVNNRIYPTYGLNFKPIYLDRPYPAATTVIADRE